MEWKEIESDWLKLKQRQPDIGDVFDKVKWEEIRLHNAPPSYRGSIPELPDEVLTFWKASQVEERKNTLQTRGPGGMFIYESWGSSDNWVGPPLTARMLSREGEPGFSLMAAWISAVISDSKAERELHYELQSKVRQCLPDDYHPWSSNTKHTLMEIVPFGVEFNLEWKTCPVTTVDSLLQWVAKITIHNQNEYRPVRISSTYDPAVRPPSEKELLRLAVQKLDNSYRR